jgi:hypothetical protein
VTKKRLLDFVQAGKRTGADLVKKRNPVEMPHTVAPQEIEATLAEAEAKADGTLWEREWAAVAARTLWRQLDEDASLSPYGARLRELGLRLEANDEREFAPLRRAIAEGTFRPDDFRASLEVQPPYQWDAYTRRLFGVHLVPARETDRPAMMVCYLPSPLDAILAIAKLLTPADVFYDIGSGLGLVTMMTAWISGAKAKGVEYEPAYHRRAEELARDLRLPVEHIRADARHVDYSDGTVFYLYDTFRGPILDDMLALLSQQKHRAIRIVSRGKSTPVLEATSWLKKIGELDSGLSLFQSY